MKSEEEIKTEISFREDTALVSDQYNWGFVAGLKFVLEGESKSSCCDVGQRVTDLYDNFVNLNEIGIRGIENELDLLAYLLGKKCSYELPARLEV